MGDAAHGSLKTTSLRPSFKPLRVAMTKPLSSWQYLSSSAPSSLSPSELQGGQENRLGELLWHQMEPQRLPPLKMELMRLEFQELGALREEKMNMVTDSKISTERQALQNLVKTQSMRKKAKEGTGLRRIESERQ